MLSNEQQIRQLIENWVAAVKRKDIDAILAYHSDDFVMFDVPPPFQSVGLDAYRKTWDTFFKYTRQGVFDIQEMKIIADENVAFCIALMRWEDSSGGNGFVPLDFRLTIGLCKSTTNG